MTKCAVDIRNVKTGDTIKTIKKTDSHDEAWDCANLFNASIEDMMVDESADNYISRNITQPVMSAVVADVYEI